MRLPDLDMILLTISVFLLSIALTAAVIAAILWRYRRASAGTPGMDAPTRPRKHHPRPVPRLGGIGLFVTFSALLAGAWAIPSWPPIEHAGALWIGAALIFSLGLIDDFRALGPWVKLIGQLAIAMTAWSLGLRVECDSDAVSLVLTVLWLVAIPNVLNLADGMDGLAGWIAVIVFGFMLGMWPGMGATLIALGVTGACLGFLIYNRHPARIFLGDGGAYLLGFLIGAFALVFPSDHGQESMIWMVFLTLGIPVLDAVLAFLRRLVRGVPVMRGDADHLHHRLLAREGSVDAALGHYHRGIIFFGLFAYMGTTGSLPLWGVIPLLVCRSILFLQQLGYATAGGDLVRTLRARREVQFATMVAEALELEVERHTSGDEFWEIFASEMSRLDLTPLPSDGSTPLTVQIPVGQLEAWTVHSTRSPADPAIAESVTECLISPLRLGVRKFGRPDWDGLS